MSQSKSRYDIGPIQEADLNKELAALEGELSPSPKSNSQSKTNSKTQSKTSSKMRLDARMAEMKRQEEEETRQVLENFRKNRPTQIQMNMNKLDKMNALSKNVKDTYNKLYRGYAEVIRGYPVFVPDRIKDVCSQILAARDVMN